ncbi:cation:proton antiporter regulatory subunit [Paenibacillus sp. FSL K6-0276]|uniref:cation:proton antiporter regulatory subunit n=1 Tax=Paenibacillus sp. FSL K6-0276 TaxID=2921450 RepID=UPI0030EE863B
MSHSFFGTGRGERGSKMDIREVDLPGIGRKYCINTRSGESLTIVIHNDERRELYHVTDGGNETLSNVTLDDEESRTVSAILAGITYKPKAVEVEESLFEDLIVDWLRINPSCPLIGRTIGELEIRERTGAAIIAVVEADKRKVLNPGPEYCFKEGSTLVAAGDAKQFNTLKRLMSEDALIK